MLSWLFCGGVDFLELVDWMLQEHFRLAHEAQINRNMPFCEMHLNQVYLTEFISLESSLPLKIVNLLSTSTN